MAYKILIVDDEKMMTELLSDHLRDCGYEAITANSGREAIELLQKKLDLIIFYAGQGRRKRRRTAGAYVRRWKRCGSEGNKVYDSTD